MTVQSGWILQLIAQRITAESDGVMKLSTAPRNDVDANFYIDVQNCFHRKTLVPDIGFFTHADRDDITTVNPTAFSLDYIVHMCERYFLAFAPHFPASKMEVIYPVEIDKRFNMKKRTIGIVQRGGFVGKGHDFMLDLARESIAKNFHFLFIGKGWDEVAKLMNLLGVSVTHIASEDYDSYPNLYDGIDYLLIPSLWEGGPMSYVEACATGTPIISGDVGFVEDFGVDYPFQSGSMDSLVDVLGRIFAVDYERRARVESYSYRKYANRIIEIVRELRGEA